MASRHMLYILYMPFVVLVAVGSLIEVVLPSEGFNIYMEALFTT
jgi:hypothetical protein